MGQKIVRQLPYLFFVLLILWLIYWAPKSIGMFGGNDNFAHFMLARYAWNYPELFLRLWGRPAYTFFFSLPACGGIEGLKVTNTILFGVRGLTNIRFSQATKHAPYRLADHFHPFCALADSDEHKRDDRNAYGPGRHWNTEPLFAT